MQLEQQLKQLIIDSLALEDISIEDIETDMPLFSSEGLGLDSVDALELGLACLLYTSKNLFINLRKIKILILLN